MKISIGAWFALLVWHSIMFFALAGHGMRWWCLAFALVSAFYITLKLSKKKNED